MQLMRVPFEGGSPEEVLRLDTNDSGVVAFCGHKAGAKCIVAEGQGNAEILSVFDPIRGRGPRVLEVADTNLLTFSFALSYDGERVAYIVPSSPRNRIRIIDLQGKTLAEVAVQSLDALGSINWSADGNSFFCSDYRPGKLRLIHVHMTGQSHALWEEAQNMVLWAIQSPDGNKLAFFPSKVNSNVYAVENP
jgi:hypothetical protein